jgi:hypothetical protein
LTLLKALTVVNRRATIRSARPQEMQWLICRDRHLLASTGPPTPPSCRYQHHDFSCRPERSRNATAPQDHQCRPAGCSKDNRHGACKDAHHFRRSTPIASARPVQPPAPEQKAFPKICDFAFSLQLCACAGPVQVSPCDVLKPSSSSSIAC